MSADTPRITDEAVARLHQRIGIPAKWHERPRNTVASEDSIRHFAVGYGDDNPLFTDPAYAEGTRWQTVVAPPLYSMSSGVSRPVRWTDEQASAMSGGDPLRGVGQYLSSEAWWFARPITPGVRLRRERFLHDVEVRDSDFGGGQAVVLTQRTVYTDDQALYAVNDRTYHHAERDRSGEQGKYRGVEIQPYSDEQLEEIFAVYEQERRRGGEALTADDLRMGDELPQIVKGPLTVTDIICYHVGIGWASTAGPLRLANQSFRKIPGFFTRNSLNAPDVAQRCHWEDEFAQQLGHPAAYDYGAMRTNWMVHLVTNWMGDDAWISRLSARARRFNYIGDTHWISGRVERVDTDAVPPRIDVSMCGVNQRGEMTCTGEATVLLPSIGAPSTLGSLELRDVPQRL